MLKFIKNHYIKTAFNILIAYITFLTLNKFYNFINVDILLINGLNLIYFISLIFWLYEGIIEYLK